MDNTQMVHIIYLSLGSNLGDRLGNLHTAINSLPPTVSHIIQSAVYETQPWGYPDQPDFLNQCIKASTSLGPAELLAFLKDIEAKMGRQETFRFGPRIIDLDILFYNDLVLDTHTLTIPHPRIAERSFILFPLADIAPDLFHPVLHKTIQQLKAGMDTSGIHLFQSTKPDLEQ
jgi:2-amino-4-hydroxy-6-hydroxymethyldihydropteridine diphosphokinase